MWLSGFFVESSIALIAAVVSSASESNEVKRPSGPPATVSLLPKGRGDEKPVRSFILWTTPLSAAKIGLRLASKSVKVFGKGSP